MNLIILIKMNADAIRNIRKLSCLILLFLKKRGENCSFS